MRLKAHKQDIATLVNTGTAQATGKSQSVGHTKGTFSVPMVSERDVLTMDRRTIRYPDGAVELKCSVNDAVMCFADYEDTGLEPEEIAELTKSLLVGMNKRNRAMELLQAESEGRLIILPCKVGDTVYAVEPDLCDLRGNDTCNAFCDGWEFSCPDFHPGNTIRQRPFHIEDLHCFGETVFRSYDEAEASLGGGKK